MTNPAVTGGRFYQNTRTYALLLSHPSGKGSVSIPGGGWVEGNFFGRFSALKEGTPPKGTKVVFSESEFIMENAAEPVVLPPIVKPHELRPAVETHVSVPPTVTPAPTPRVVVPDHDPFTAPVAPAAIRVPVVPPAPALPPVVPATPAVVPATPVVFPTPDKTK